MEQELLNKIWNKLSKIDKLDAIESRLDNMESKVNKIDAIEAKVSEIDTIKSRLNSMESTLESVKNSVAIFENVDRTKIQAILDIVAPLLEKSQSFDSRISGLEDLAKLHSFQIDILTEAK